MLAQPQLGLPGGVSVLPGLLPGISSLLHAAAPWLQDIPRQSLSDAERSLLQIAECTAVVWPDSRIYDSSWINRDGLTPQLAIARPVEERRALGQFFTPAPIVEVMVNWVLKQDVDQIVDAGCGTGVFAIAAAQAAPQTPVLAIDSDPVATLACRARVKSLRLKNISVQCADFLRAPLALPMANGRTAFIGNPPYVRHHRLSPEMKMWAAKSCAEMGITFSKLAGLHAYFFLATALHARPDDVGCYITSAEWLDVNYGICIRQLLKDRLGVLSLSLLADSKAAFEDAMTSAVITCFKVGARPSRISVSVVDEFKEAQGGQKAAEVSADRLTGRWGGIFRASTIAPENDECVRLGDLASVHRGIATGANKFFVMPPEEAEFRGLARFAQPVISAGRQILDCGGCLSDQRLDSIIFLPREIEELPESEREAVNRYLEEGRVAGVNERYICRHRTPWWWLGTQRPAPIVASYMARRAPAFALNTRGAFLINVGHGLFPRFTMTEQQIGLLVEYLNSGASQFVGGGRTYQGGLEKFEPREMEDLKLPLPAELRSLVR